MRIVVTNSSTFVYDHHMLHVKPIKSCARDVERETPCKLQTPAIVQLTYSRMKAWLNSFGCARNIGRKCVRL